MSEEDDVILTTGATVPQLSRMFNIPGKVIREKLQDLDPIAKRNQMDLYQVGLAAQYLVTPLSDLDEFIEKMTEHDLPPALQKAFWAGLRERQKFEEDAGDLWPTTAVIENVSTLFKTLKMSMNVVRDTVERETELTERQRQIITSLIDGALEDMYETVVEKFSATGPLAGVTEKNERPDTVEEEL